MNIAMNGTVYHVETEADLLAFLSAIAMLEALREAA